MATMAELGQRFGLDLTPSTFQDRLSSREQKFGILPADQLITPEDRAAQYDNLERMVGNTPLIDMSMPNGNRIWIKVESENPTESHYDRASLTVLRKLEQDGLIKPGDKILEGTSGSAGRSFAYFCNRLGFGLDMVVAREIPSQRTRDMEQLGAHLIVAEGKGGMGDVPRKTKRMLATLRSKKSGYVTTEYSFEGKPVLIFRKGNETICAPNHSENIITPHSFGDIASEVIAQLPEGASIDTFIGTLGNGATMKGISEVLRARYGDIIAIGTETQNSPTNAIRKIREGLIAELGQVDEELLRKRFFEMYGFKMPEKGEMTYHDSFGSSAEGYEPPFVEVDKIDHIVLMGDEWRDLKRRHNTYTFLNNHVTNSIGNTSAENLYVAIKLVEYVGWHNRNILVLRYDKGDQYTDWPPVAKDHAYPLPDYPPIEDVPYCFKHLVVPLSGSKRGHRLNIKPAA